MHIQLTKYKVSLGKGLIDAPLQLPKIVSSYKFWRKGTATVHLRFPKYTCFLWN